jgi:hypothetical protein
VTTGQKYPKNNVKIRKFSGRFKKLNSDFSQLFLLDKPVSIIMQEIFLGLLLTIEK